MRDEVEGDGELTVPFLELRLTTAEVYEDVPLPPLRVKEGEAEAEWDVGDPVDAEIR